MIYPNVPVGELVLKRRRPILVVISDASKTMILLRSVLVNENSPV